MSIDTDMNESEKNIPDDFWRKAFDEAAETPSPRVWATIERRLDESKNPPILPLWGTGLASSRPLVWGSSLAAAVALLLVGWWVMPSQSPKQTVARVSRSESVAALASPKTAQATSPTNQADNPETGTVALATKRLPNSSAPLVHSVDQVVIMPERPSNPESIAQIDPQPESSQAVRLSSVQPPALSTFTDAPVATTVMRSASHMAVASYQPAPAQAINNLTLDATPPSGQLVMQFQSSKPAADQRITGLKLAGSIQTESIQAGISGSKSVQTVVVQTGSRQSGPIQTGVDPIDVPEEVEHIRKKRSSKDVWASAGMMTGAFNPMIAVRTMQPANAYTINPSAADQASVSSRANFSVAYQIGAGVQLTDHWSIESGAGYLVGRSTVDTPIQSSVYLMQTANIAPINQRSNLYVDALRTSSHSGLVSGRAYQDLLTTNAAQTYDSRNRQLLTNVYQYIQVPVQVGYQLRPRKRFGLALLGGLITNIFVRNTVDDQLVVTTKDGVYRPLSWAATLGARFRYRPSKQWSASLAGLYQPSLGLGTQADSQIQSHPTSAGMSFGVDYHF